MVQIISSFNSAVENKTGPACIVIKWRQLLQTLLACQCITKMIHPIKFSREDYTEQNCLQYSTLYGSVYGGLLKGELVSPSLHIGTTSPSPQLSVGFDGRSPKCCIPSLMRRVQTAKYTWKAK